MTQLCTMTGSAQIPVIDMQQKKDQLLSAVRQACHSTGFFQGGISCCNNGWRGLKQSNVEQSLLPVVNHGIPAKTISQHWEASRSFFTLPEATKREIIADDNFRQAPVVTLPYLHQRQDAGARHWVARCILVAAQRSSSSFLPETALFGLWCLVMPAGHVAHRPLVLPASSL